MTSLRTSDLRAVVEFVGEMGETDAEDAFPAELLARLARLVPAEAACYNERSVPTRELLAASAWCVDDDGEEDVDVESWDDEPSGVDGWDFVVNHPANAYRRRTGFVGALADSDLWSRRARLNHDVFASEYHAYWGLVDVVGIRLSDSRSHTMSLFLESSDRDFTARDKAVLDALRPHLAARHRQAGLQRSLTDALSALEAASGSSEVPAVVLVGAGGRVEFASVPALALVREYFGEDGARLPRPLEDWRRAGAATAFETRRNGRRLVVDAVGGGRSALVLREELAAVAALTAREWDVMRCVDAGKTNEEIAQLLWITPATVKKHLEHVYDKLGVRSRTAAAARLRPSIAEHVPRSTDVSAFAR